MKPKYSTILKRMALAGFACTLFGCASSGVLPMGEGSYIVSKNSAKVGGGISAAAAAEVNQEANDFCSAKGKKMETSDLKLTPGTLGALGSATLQFKCI